MVEQVACLLHRPAAPSPLCMRPHLLQLSTEQEPQNGPNPFLLIPDNCCCLFELNNIGWTRRESKHWNFGKNLRFSYLLWHNPARICYPRSDSISRSKCCISLSEWVYQRQLIYWQLRILMVKDHQHKSMGWIGQSGPLKLSHCSTNFPWPIKPLHNVYIVQ